MFKFLNNPTTGSIDWSQVAGFAILVIAVGVAAKHLPLPASLKP